ncbi:60S ribosomal protein L18ae [Stemphylium lycopersici]|uniref:60S ribosomal protein L18ae n=1 Tax=Stemphylium lycopersici TaxID=183478 RepID=A0A364N5D7_STELY|nr:60s ribosomal protein l20 [Stemphylium lycopersici]RAQ99437.1 60S ribosomal protein L18ae [Stemphylium lycopersici]RAR12246.1 60S ribosomal protein L18ae [Stemphylium lycopersici]
MVTTKEETYAPACAYLDPPDRIPMTLARPTCAAHELCNCWTRDFRAYTSRFQEYQIIGRHLPSEANPAPKIYRMRIFAPNEVVAKSRFWYFLGKLRKIKKANGEIVSVNQIHEKKPQKVKNFGIWLKYDSRSGTHNMYKEYREMSRVAAVDALYQDMAARHRSRFRSVQILKVVEVEKSDDIRRPYIKQLLTKNLKFPLPHRINKKAGKKVFSATRPSTFF